MFDISWSELLILGIVTLIFVGPKELPSLLRTFGRYAGMVRRQASEFRAHFDEAMREAELADLKKEVEGVRDEIVTQVKHAELEANVVKAHMEREALDAARAAEAAPAKPPAAVAEALPTPPVAKEG